ncbi:unnamed protein product [Somion occarium]|uniref:DUF221-domain-containing protein n=1 Tax=Somion occarium TaxID=3059160 RepID=A0ABP1CL36_9APHY
MSEVMSDKAQGLDSQTFLTALITNTGVLAVEIVAFVFLKHRFSRIYEPRSYLPPPDKRAIDLPKGPWKWLLAVIAVPTNDVLHKNGMDAYMFLRFLRLLIILFACITLMTWIILLPVDAAHIQDSNFSDGLAQLSWGNIPSHARGRYAAHILVAYLSTFLTLFMIRKELVHYTQMRQNFLTSRSHSQLAQARTVLITNIPEEMCDEKELHLWASFVPGGIQNIWVYRDTTELNKEYNARLEACEKLEFATSKLVRQVILAKTKQDKLEKKAAKAKAKSEGKGIELVEKEARVAKSNVRPYSTDTTRPLRPRTRTVELEAGVVTDHTASVSSQTIQAEPSNPESLIEKYVPKNKRPHHRLGFLGLWGKKADTIEWCKEEIARLNREIDERRAALRETKPLGSAFIQCNLQLGAHVLAQCVSYHKPLMMANKWIEVAPKDIIWDNIDDGAYETRFRYVTSWLGSIALIVLWFVPVAFVGTLSNVSALCEKVSWLCWIQNAPTPIPGIIQGVLPPLFLAILFAVLPQLLKALAWYENIPRWSLISLSVYKRYYLFLVIHGFLVVTLSSGVTSAAAAIVENPTKAVTELASQLPNASIFFLTWTLTQGLTGAGSALLQVGVLFMHFIKRWFLGRTPRQAYAVTFLMPMADFGLVLPRISLLATIALTYSVLSPIINGLAMVAFLLFFFAWKFLLTWVFDQPDESETGGQYFPLAINFLFVGLYVEHFCLAVLFFLKVSDGASFIGLGVLMILLMGLTASVQILFQRSFDPITKFLPMSLATKKMQERWGKDKHRREHPRESETNDDDPDLFSREGIRSVVRRRINVPVHKLSKKVQNDIAMSVLKKDKGGDASDSDEETVTVIPVASQSSRQALASAHAVDDPHSSSEPASPHPSTSGESMNSAKSKSKLPTFAPPSPPARSSQDGDDEDEDFDENGFNHPSTYTEQPWVWIPKDDLGVSELLVRELQAAGVGASDTGATMDRKGTVEVQRNPPDEEWAGGHDA